MNWFEELILSENDMLKLRRMYVILVALPFVGAIVCLLFAMTR